MKMLLNKYWESDAIYTIIKIRRNSKSKLKRQNLNKMRRRMIEHRYNISIDQLLWLTHSFYILFL